jgi:hypothetical protein
LLEKIGADQAQTDPTLEAIYIALSCKDKFVLK